MRRKAAHPLTLLFARLSAATRRTLFLLVLLGVGARLLVILTAFFVVVAGDMTTVAEAGLVAAALLVVQRLAANRLRVGVECDLQRAAAIALLEGDVLVVRSWDPEIVVLEGESASRTVLSATVPGLIADAIALVVAIPLVVTQIPSRVLIVAAVALVVAFGAVMVLRGVTRRVQEGVVESSRRVWDSVFFAMRGALEIVAGGGEARFTGTLDARVAEYARVARRATFVNALLGRLPIAAAVVLVVAAALLDGSVKAEVERVVLGRALVFAACAPPLLGAVLGFHELVRSAAALGQFADLLGTTPRRELDGATKGKKVPATEGPFVAEGVSYAYPGATKEVLRELSFRWTAERPLVLVGANGSGKSTVLRLLLGLGQPRAGKILFGETSLDELDVVALRSRVAYLPQRPYLGEPRGSVGDALRMLVTGADDDALLSALARAGVSVALDAHVGELSAGQRQRIALARVMLQDARIVMLDEPDANLDHDGVVLVRQRIEEMIAAGKMVAVAAHTPEVAGVPGTRVELVTR